MVLMDKECPVCERVGCRILLHQQAEVTINTPAKGSESTINTASDEAKRRHHNCTMRDRRKNPERYRGYMRDYMKRYRARNADPG